ncbi:hypothetical protein PFISCL1PPCAC_11602, partial [Pristionchus fissidentatus]
AAPEAPVAAAPAPAERLDTPSNQEMSASCPICMEPFRNTSNGLRVARVLSCGHLVCTECAGEFLRDKMRHRLTADLSRHPCVTCRRRVYWTGLPECKTVGYLYGQLALTNAAAQPSAAQEVPKIRSETRKRVREDMDSVVSSTEEMSKKIRKLIKRTNEVHEIALDESSTATSQAMMDKVESKEQGEWLASKAEEKSWRVKVLEEQFKEHCRKMNEILDEMAENSLAIPRILPNV